MKRPLVIIGSYPNSDNTKRILKESIIALKDEFDILLSTHYPADEETQKLVNYYVYDFRNEMIVNDNPFFWAHYPNPPVYLEIHGNEKKNTDHGFAVFREIMNGINLIKNDYDNFFYIEGDCIFSPSDVALLKRTSEISKNLGKRGWVFRYDNFINSVMFNMDIQFFIDNIPFPKTVEEYQALVSQYNSYGILENLLYCILEKKQTLNDLHIIENILQNDYFTTSKLQLNSVYTGTMSSKPISLHFRFHVAKIDNENNLAIVYLNNNDSAGGEMVEIRVDDNHIMTVDTSVRGFAVERIYPNNDKFNVKLNKFEMWFNRSEILTEKSFIKFL